MAVFDCNCGPCDSGVTLDVEDEHSAWAFIQRWSSAHVKCGWIVSSGQPDVSQPERLVLGPEDQADPGDVQTEGGGTATLEA